MLAIKLKVVLIDFIEKKNIVNVDILPKNVTKFLMAIFNGEIIASLGKISGTRTSV